MVNFPNTTQLALVRCPLQNKWCYNR